MTWGRMSLFHDRRKLGIIHVACEYIYFHMLSLNLIYHLICPFAWHFPCPIFYWQPQACGLHEHLLCTHPFVPRSNNYNEPPPPMKCPHMAFGTTHAGSPSGAFVDSMQGNPFVLSMKFCIIFFRSFVFTAFKKNNLLGSSTTWRWYFVFYFKI